MAHEPATPRARNGQRTITLPITEEQYETIIDDPQYFRTKWLDPVFPDYSSRIARNSFQTASRKRTK